MLLLQRVYFDHTNVFTSVSNMSVLKPQRVSLTAIYALLTGPVTVNAPRNLFPNVMSTSGGTCVLF